MPPRGPPVAPPQGRPGPFHPSGPAAAPPFGTRGSGPVPGGPVPGGPVPGRPTFGGPIRSGVPGPQPGPRLQPHV
jgi:hypothetical protein